MFSRVFETMRIVIQNILWNLVHFFKSQRWRPGLVVSIFSLIFAVLSLILFFFHPFLDSKLLVWVTKLFSHGCKIFLAIFWDFLILLLSHIPISHLPSHLPFACFWHDISGLSGSFVFLILLASGDASSLRHNHPCVKKASFLASPCFDSTRLSKQVVSVCYRLQKNSPCKRESEMQMAPFATETARPLLSFNQHFSSDHTGCL